VISRVRWLALGALAAWFLYCFGLAQVGFLSVDEPRYAWIGRAMAESGDWITPRLYGEPWLEKPPLLYWMIASGWTLGLSDEWAARLPVALSTLAFFALFWWCLRREYGEEIATASTGILATCGGWLLYSHVAVTDIPLSVTYGGAMMLAWRGRLRLAGICLGLAVLAKALVPLALALPLLWWLRGRWRALAVPLLLMLAVAAPWYIAAFARHGRALFDELIVRQHFARVFNAKEDVLHPQPLWFYVPVLLTILLPWTPLALAAHPRRLWADERARFFVVWLGFGFVLFSLSSGKLPGYLLPLLPAASVLLGISVVESTHPRFWLAVVAGVAGMVYAAPNDKLLEYIVAGATAMPVTHLAWAGLAGGLVIGWWAGGAFLRTFAVVVILMGGLRYWAAGIAERQTARPHAAMTGKICAEPDLHRAWRYGLSYYGGAALPDCKSAPRRWHAGNSEFGLYLSDTASQPSLPYP
jgi:4-amino-4-deoxy-L-arabinose transferase-like glycosyltransferase